MKSLRDKADHSHEPTGPKAAHQQIDCVSEELEEPKRQNTADRTEEITCHDRNRYNRALSGAACFHARTSCVIPVGCQTENNTSQTNPGIRKPNSLRTERSKFQGGFT